MAAQPVAVTAGGLQHHGEDASAALLADFDAEFGRDSGSAAMEQPAAQNDLGLDADLASAIAAEDFEPVSGHSAELPASLGPAALPDAPVYSKPVIEVEVPGLDETRSLQRDSITRKLDELQRRGLTTADIGGL